MNKYPKGYGWIKLTDLNFCTWNYKKDDDEKAKKLKANLKRNGQIENLLVYNDGKEIIVANGNHRLQALQGLGKTEAFCFYFGKLSHTQAVRLALETNETKFKSDLDKLQGLVAELGLEFTQEDLNSTLPFSEIEISTWGNFDDEKPEPENEPKKNLKMKYITLAVTLDVKNMWEDWKSKLNNKFNDVLSDNKCLEFALAEALNTPLDED